MRLGPYEILAPLGAGGMGEVYKAKDTRLQRTVAVKVLPGHLSENPELRQRFEREARAISSLSHPHICTLHDIGSENGVDFLVMELLEGQSLAERLEKGALPTDQVLKFGVEIAEALEAAHRHRIVHRDLKPGNIMLTKTGVKLLDFGLAKMAAAEKSPSDSSSLPTEAAPSRPLTEKGTVMGTFQYMAPEQLEGNDADSRTDIFAFGCVLYEMATGRKAFTGASQASLMTAIMSKEPEPISALAPMSPPALDRLVKTCLAKDPDDRWQSSHDVMAELRWIAEAGSQAGAPAVVASRRRSRERYAWAIAAAATAVAFAQGFWHRGQAPVPGRIFRSVISLPPGPIVDGTDSSLTLSPDGRILALALRDSGGSSQIYLRTLDSLSVTPLSGTQRATCPFWSPDGKSVGFFADRKLKRIEIAGGAVQTICDAPEGRGGAWGPDGTIVFAPSLFGALSRVAASGGTAVPAEPPVSARTVSHRYPNFLPGGKTVLFYSNDTEEKGDGSVIALDLATQKERLVLRAPSAAYFIPPGYLAFVRQKNVMVQRFDPKSLRLSGEAVPIAENVVCNQSRGTGEFTFSGTSLFLYQTEETPQQSHLVWFDIDGKKLSSVGEPAAFDGLAIAPDGRRVAAAIDGLDGFQIWMIDLVSGVRTRFTFDVEEAINPVWSPDGSRLAYAGRVAGRAIVQVRDAGGGSPAQTIFSGPNFCNTTDWSPDGSALSFTTQSSDTRSSDIGALPITGDHKPRMILASSANEYRASFSPDGRWLAYISDESGSPELYVTLYTGTGGKWQISSGAMATFWWNGPGEIYYSTSGGQAFAVAIKPRGTGLDIGVARRIFGETQIPRDIAMSYSPALKRFLLALPVGEPQRPPITLVTNWAAALEKR